MIKVLALDLEGTLINSVCCPVARPGLYQFLSFCFKNIPHTVLFTAADNYAARGILIQLEEDGLVPPGTGGMPIVEWIKRTNHELHPKNLQYVQRMYPGVKIHEIYLVDDIEGFVALGQYDQWVPIACCYGVTINQSDKELLRIEGILVDLLSGSLGIQQRGYTGVPSIGT